jgi:hypothetical protein
MSAVAMPQMDDKERMLKHPQLYGPRRSVESVVSI